MAIGYSLHIGINNYGGPDNLGGCINDATAVMRLADTCKFSKNVALCNQEAVFERIDTEVRRMAALLKKGDMGLISYSGHGDSVYVGDRPEEPDKYNETWYLADGTNLLDDKIAEWWRLFAEGVRVLVLSDSCHSGTVTDIIPAATLTSLRGGIHRLKRSNLGQIPHWSTTVDSSQLGAGILLLSGCQDSQLSGDGEFGVFTAALLKAWDEGRFTGDYTAFHAAINRIIDQPSQVPNLYYIGNPALKESFTGQRPFSIDAGSGPIV